MVRRLRRRTMKLFTKFSIIGVCRVKYDYDSVVLYIYIVITSVINSHSFFTTEISHCQF